MDESISDGRQPPKRPHRAARTVLTVAAVLCVLFAGWLCVGNLRAEGIARDYFAHAHGEGATVVNVTVDAVSPAIPPFWVVRISGDVIEPGDTAPVYRSYMELWVEPFSGYVFVNGSG